MAKGKLIILLSLLALFPTCLWGQLPLVPGTIETTPYKHRPDRTVNFGVKGGFTSSLFLVSDFILNGISIDEIQNNYKIGYFGSLFMRINFGHHFLQPELSYTVNRCNITFDKSIIEDTEENSAPDMASITSSIHSFEIPVIYGYNIIKEGPYSLAVFGGPKIRYIWDHKSKVTFENFDQQNVQEELYPLNFSFTAGVAVRISRIFFDFRYDIGLHNISKRITYKPVFVDEPTSGEVVPANQIRFNRRENVLSFSLGVFF